MSDDERVGGYVGGKPASEMGPPARMPSGTLTAIRQDAIPVAAVREVRDRLRSYETAVSSSDGRMAFSISATALDLLIAEHTLPAPDGAGDPETQPAKEGT